MEKDYRPIVRYSFVLLAVVLITAVTGNFNTSIAQTKSKSASTRRATPSIPVGTEMKVRLETEIDSKKALDGDRFTAIVISPEKYMDSTVEGHLARVKQSGKMKGNTELSLAFDRIQLNNGKTIPIAAQVVRVYDESSGKEKKVDEEGNVQSGGQGKETAKRTGGGAALGAIVGGIAGGGKGAAIGAAVGGGAGAGSTLITGSKKLKLEPGTEILIRTTR